jgi:type I restriction enzyme S subunit
VKYPRYLKYKDSGVEWLGEVPAGWKILPLKRDIAFLTSGSRGWAGNYSEDGAIFLRIGNLTREDIRLDFSDIQRVSVPDGSEGMRTRVVPNDLLFSITAYLGSIAVVPSDLEEAYVNQHIALVRLHKQIFIPRWVGFYTLSCVGKAYFAERSYGGTKIQLALDDIADMPIAVPTLLEQQTIATFLDHNCAKIDALIAEQEKLIALLREKRQAVISHAVTKGLNPDAPMKDSGVEWLGEVPEGWKVCLIKYYMSLITDGAHISPETEDGIYGFISTKDIDIKGINFDDCLKTSQNNYDYLVKTGCQPQCGDILFSKDGTIGRCTVVENDRNFVVASSLIILKPNKEILKSHFFRYFSSSKYFLEQVNAFVRGAGLPRLSINNLCKAMGAFPPIAEQEFIIVYLDAETAKIDALIAESEKAVALLKERRSALISAAVTGKIDVRNIPTEN